VATWFLWMIGARIHTEIHAHAHMVAQTLSVLFREVIVSLSCTGGPVDVEDAWRACKRSLFGYKCSLTVDAEMLNMTNSVFLVLMF
jgi:hypothetical protein